MELALGLFCGEFGTTRSGDHKAEHTLGQFFPAKPGQTIVSRLDRRNFIRRMASIEPQLINKDANTPATLLRHRSGTP